MNNMDLSDLEFVIVPDFNKSHELTVGVLSRTANCSCWIRVTDEELKNGGIPLILTALSDMKDAMTLQYQL